VASPPWSVLGSRGAKLSSLLPWEMTMKFEHLSDGDFEELTYDLLTALGFVDVNWRRGSGKAGTSADQGRDIVAQLRQREIDGTEHLETWFIQCKQRTADLQNRSALRRSGFCPSSRIHKSRN